VVLLLYTYPAFVTGLSFALGYEGISAKVVLSLLMALGGLVLVANPVLSLSTVGIILALGGSVTYTCYILVSSRNLKGVSGELSGFYVFGGATLSFGVLGLSTGKLLFTWNSQGWLWIVLISIISTSLAVILFFKGLRLVGPSKASILSTAELVTSVVAAFIIFGETLSTLQLIGGMLILAAVVISSLPYRSRG